MDCLCGRGRHGGSPLRLRRSRSSSYSSVLFRVLALATNEASRDRHDLRKSFGPRKAPVSSRLAVVASSRIAHEGVLAVVEAGLGTLVRRPRPAVRRPPPLPRAARHLAPP